ncbi:Nuclear RNA export factor 1 [Varanus komodoensis]|nr:Nuclear RNA export factor 1 [Varanus komodoensis]
MRAIMPLRMHALVHLSIWVRKRRRVWQTRLERLKSVSCPGVPKRSVVVHNVELSEQGNMEGMPADTPICDPCPEHDDRVGGGGGGNRGFPGRRRKGRGPFRGKMYSEMNHHQRSWTNAGPSPCSCPEEEDGDVLMSDPHDALRSRYTPYGSRPNRPERDRGGLNSLNLTVRRNLNIAERTTPRSSAPKKSWFRATIPYGRKYEKAWLISAIQNLCTVPFNPVELHYANNRVMFYVEDSATANALRQVSRKIVAPDGYKVVILLNPCSPPPTVQRELKPEEIEQLKGNVSSSVQSENDKPDWEGPFSAGTLPNRRQAEKVVGQWSGVASGGFLGSSGRGLVVSMAVQCMSKRYDPSQQGLDLKNIHTDPDLVATNIDMVLSRRSCMLAVLQIIQENIPELLSLNLSDNKLYRLDDLAELPQKAPNLKILNLSSNQLKTERELDRLKGLKLEELWLDSNPMCDNFRDQSTYISAIRERFPKLLRLDGHELPPPISFDVEAPTTLPPSKGSYFCSEGLKALIVQFLQQYYTIYDSGNRQGLLDAYHDGACCSLSIPFSLHNPSRSSLAEYFKNSRNVKKLKDPSKP